uniref:Uncharacterized protein n=1 Tax=Brassica oleracea var. oleracea TaxID=109376 RepID=A0A0D3BGK7_BRAOL
MLSLPSGLECRDVAVRAGGVCEPAHHQQQDRPASAEAPPATRPLMRTSPHISIPIYLCFSFIFELLGFSFELIILCYDLSLSILLILHVYGLSSRANLADLC